MLKIHFSKRVLRIIIHFSNGVSVNLAAYSDLFCLIIAKNTAHARTASGDVAITVGLQGKRKFSL